MSEDKLRVDCWFDVKASSDAGEIEGHGAVFGNVDLGLDRIEKGAFKTALRETDTLPMLWQHSSDEVIGLWGNMAEDDTGLFVKGQLNLDVQRAREARSLVAQGAVKGLSIGYIPRDWKYEDDVRVLKRVDIIEVSLATFPMNPEARVSGVKNATRKELEHLVRERLGLSKLAAAGFCAEGIKGLPAVMRDKRSDDKPAAKGQDDSKELHQTLSAISQMASRIKELSK